MNEYTNELENAEAFKEMVKNQMDQEAFKQLDDLKQQMANDFIKQED